MRKRLKLFVAKGKEKSHNTQHQSESLELLMPVPSHSLHFYFIMGFADIISTRKYDMVRRQH
jgi:hypothetical protein